MNGISNLIVGAAGSIIATILTSLAWLTWNSYRRWDALWNFIGFKRADETWLFYGNVQKEKLSPSDSGAKNYATFEYGDIASVVLAFDRFKTSSRGKVRHSVGSDLNVADDGNVVTIGGPKWNRVTEKLLGMLGSPLYFERDVAGVIEKRRMHHSQNIYTQAASNTQDRPLRITDYGFIICGRGFLPGGLKGAVLIAGYTTAGVLIATEFFVRMTSPEIRTLKRRFKGDKRFAILIQGVLEVSEGRLNVSEPPKLVSLIPESDFRNPYTYNF
ncbi:MAG: hypothetical protein M3R69_17340 [Acidobacteriota bacterium]|nr:hypothetical protein [Acidobacteriota bacterium]